MPILRVSALPQQPGIDVTAALSKTCLALAEAMGVAANQVWGQWQPLAPGSYVEGAEGPSVQPRSTHPPVVELMALEGRPPELMARMLTSVGTTLPAALGLDSGNVYVRYVEMEKAMVFTGARIVAAR